MEVELLKWLGSLKPGDVSAYALLVIIIVFGMMALQKEWIVTGRRWSDKIKECDSRVAENAKLQAALEVANDSIKKMVQADTERLVELTQLRVERQYGWQPPTPTKPRGRRT